MFWNCKINPVSSGYFNITHSESEVPLKRHKRMRGVRASEIIVVKSESGQYISTGLTSSLGLFSLIYWPLSLFTPLRSLLWKVISEALIRGHKFILFSHHQYNQYKALLCSCSPISISAFMAFLGYFWFWMGDIEVVRWNGVDFLVPKHLRKSKIGLLEQISAKNPYVTFFLGHPVEGTPFSEIIMVMLRRLG